MVTVISYDMLWTALCSLAVLPIVSLIKKDHWPNAVNFLLAAVLCAVVAAGNLVFANNIHSFAQFVPYWATALAAAQSAFHLYFDGSLIEAWMLSLFGKTKAPPA